MLKIIRRVFSFGDYSATHPNQPHPGDMLDAQFDEIIDRIDEWDAKIKRIVKDDGKVAASAIDEFSVNPVLVERIRSDVMDKVAPALEAMRKATATPQRIRDQIRLDAAEAARHAAHAATIANQVGEISVVAHEEIDAALAKSRALMIAALGAQDGWSNAKNDAFAADENARLWAEVSMDWAEYMPGPLPADILAWMGITGDHWSSRWWANQAAQISADVAVDVAAAIDAAARAEAAAGAAEISRTAAQAAEEGAEAAAVVAQDAATSASADAADAAASAAEAAADATEVEDLYDQFDDRYLGSKTTAPSTDNDGDPLLDGALYWDTTVTMMRVWNGTTWQSMTDAGGPADNAIDVVFAPYGTLSSTNVQAALQELNDDDQLLDTRLDALEAAPPSYTESAADARFINVTGDAMTGPLTVQPPSGPAHAASKGYVDTTLTAYAPLESPEFTGNPTAPTPAVNDNDNSIATTAFVATALTSIVGGAIIADTAPSSPKVGQLWWDSDVALLYIWYNDGDSGQWVQTIPSGASGIADAPSDGKNYVRKNGAWVEVPAAPVNPMVFDTNGDAVVKFGASIVVRIKPTGLILTKDDVEVFSVSV